MKMLRPCLAQDPAKCGGLGDPIMRSLEFGARSDANRYALLLIAPWAERQAEGKYP